MRCVIRRDSLENIFDLNPTDFELSIIHIAFRSPDEYRRNMTRQNEITADIVRLYTLRGEHKMAEDYLQTIDDEGFKLETSRSIIGLFSSP